jgi:hypothetical protein
MWALKSPRTGCASETFVRIAPRLSRSYNPGDIVAWAAAGGGRKSARNRSVIGDSPGAIDGMKHPPMNVVERRSAKEPAPAPNAALVSRLSGATFSPVDKDRCIPVAVS